MKYIITESKLQDIALNWMNKNYGLDKLERAEHPKHPDSIFYLKDGKVVMVQDNLHNDFWFNYDNIYLFFHKILGMEFSEIDTIMLMWLKENLNLSNFTPLVIYRSWQPGWNPENLG